MMQFYKPAPSKNSGLTGLLLSSNYYLISCHLNDKGEVTICCSFIFLYHQTIHAHQYCGDLHICHRFFLETQCRRIVHDLLIYLFRELRLLPLRFLLLRMVFILVFRNSYLLFIIPRHRTPRDKYRLPIASLLDCYLHLHFNIDTGWEVKVH